MYCIHCGRQIPEKSRFCPNCGSAQPQEAPAPGQAPEKKKKSPGTKILIGILVFVLAWLGAGLLYNFIDSYRVTPEELDSLVQSTDAAVASIEELMDPVVLNMEPGVNDLSDIDARQASFSIMRSSSLLSQRYHGLTERRGWKSDRYRAYEQLYDAYWDLYELMDGIYSMDPGYQYSRALMESSGIPFYYSCEDPAAMRAAYEAMVNEYQACRAGIA